MRNSGMEYLPLLPEFRVKRKTSEGAGFSFTTEFTEKARRTTEENMRLLILKVKIDILRNNKHRQDYLCCISKIIFLI